MSAGRITLLVEDLSQLAAALPAGQRYPALERILARGTFRRVTAETPNHLRYRLFGLEPSGHLPVAALTRLAAGGNPKAGSYWLRADPVTLRADMTRVFMTSCGLSGFDAAEREGVAGIVSAVLAREGFELEQDEPPWCFSLHQPLAFEFTPLHEALGMDMAEALPASASARRWKRILTDIQVELHHCDVNEQRRSEGREEINSVWFWGGGAQPDRFAGAFDSVVGDDPVARGLGVLSGSSVYAPDKLESGEGRLLVDWVMRSADALAEADALERVAGRVLETAARGGRSLDLLDGGGAAWRFDAGARFRFWKRPAPLAETFDRVLR